MKVELKYQVITITKTYKTTTWRYATQEEAEEQYDCCLGNKDNKIIELQQVIVLKQIP